ncbi:MAG: AAA family ATPase [Methylobacter sp.]|nr:AAA family ATPase [Methylobacter sp.]
MLTNLRIKNFRMLEDLEIPKLGRVNLIVGKNNSGKSTILEALRLYASKAHPKLLREILQGHDESFNIDADSNIDNQEQNWYGLKHLFPNRKFPTDDNSYISIVSDEKSLIKIEPVFYYLKEDQETNADGDIIDIIHRRITIKQSEFSGVEDLTELVPAIRVTLGSGRSALLDLAGDMRKSITSIHWRFMDDPGSPKSSYVSTALLASEALAKLWDQITLSPNEDTVLRALKVIDPQVERLAFIEDRNRYSSRDNSRLAIVKLKNSDDRIPLNSMGDGMSRILQLILSVFPAKDGVLLIDEFENGLHFSVQEEVWRIIFELAKELNIQVFATTHSWDCIESFTNVAVENSEDGVLLKVSKSKLTSDNGKIIATVYDEEALKTVTASALEVR